MSQNLALDIMTSGFLTIIKVSFPVLIIALLEIGRASCRERV